MRIAIILTITLLLAGCQAPETSNEPADTATEATQPGAVPDASTDDPSPSMNETVAGNETASSEDQSTFAATFYLHADGDRQWMDTQIGPTGTISGSNTPASDNTYHRFVLEPAIDRDVVFGAQAHIQIHWSVQRGVYADMDAGARLIINGTTYEATASGNALVVDLPAGAASGDEIALEVCICGSGTATSNYVIDLDGRTWLNFAA